jgi:hypothetical protein
MHQPIIEGFSLDKKLKGAKGLTDKIFDDVLLEQL